MGSGDHWQQTYEDKGPEEVSWYQPLPEPSLEALDRLGVGPEASLVDVGAGTSTLVDVLLQRGWGDLTVVDIAAPALEVGRARLGPRAAGVEWIVADITRWRPDRNYDVWHDRAVFHFLVEQSDRIAYIEALRTATRPGSHAIMATFAPDGPEQCSGLPVRRYDGETLSAELAGAFSPVEAWREAHVTPWQAIQSFQWCLFRRD